jgi:hypothetical protein
VVLDDAVESGRFDIALPNQNRIERAMSTALWNCPTFCLFGVFNLTHQPSSSPLREAAMRMAILLFPSPSLAVP